MEELLIVNTTSALVLLSFDDLRVEALCWLVVSGKVSMANNLRRGLSSVDHLFLHYEFSYALWCYYLVKCSVLWCLPGTKSRLSWGIISFKCSNVIWMPIPITILWPVRKEQKQNDRIVRELRRQLKISCLSRNKFNCFKVDNIFHNWEASLGCGPCKVKKLLSWSFCLGGVLKLNVDGEPPRVNQDSLG